jgi:hypothetical protein
MNPAELAALEVEVDKQAADAKVAFHFATGVKLAQEAVELYKETGELSPVFSLLTPAKVAAEAGSLDAELDKCSAEQLAAIEAELDKSAELEAEKAASEEYAKKYFDMGVKMANDVFEDMKSGKKVAGVGSFIQNIGKTQFKPGSGGAKLFKNVGGFAKRNPGVTGAAIGAGGLMAAQSAFGDKK